MKLTEILIEQILEPDWNPNQMDLEMGERLQNSLDRFGPVVPPVVRKTSGKDYETIDGAQRVRSLRELGVKLVECVVVNVDDAEARLLAQALNHIHGSDDREKREEALRVILDSTPRGEVLRLVPETAGLLAEITAFSPESLADHLTGWQQARRTRLKHFSARLTDEQHSVVEQAIAKAAGSAPKDPANPNRPGNALYHICRTYLDRSSPIDARL